MINVLNIYKFSFLFIENKYEETLFNSISIDITEMLLYNEIKYSKKSKETSNLKIVSFDFFSGKIEIFYNKSLDYYIPKFQLNLDFEKDIDYSLLKKIIELFREYGLDNYIFDYDKNLDLGYYRLKNLSYLESNFSKYDEKNLEKFLRNKKSDYIEEELKREKVILDSFLYLIYISFIFYRNFLAGEGAIDEIGDIKNSDAKREYIDYFSLPEARLKHINNLNLVNFKKYQKMLDIFFELLKK